MDSDLPQGPTPPAFLPSGPGSNPQLSEADALVQRLLDGAANKRPLVGLFNSRESDLFPVATLYGDVEQPFDGTTTGNQSALISIPTRGAGLSQMQAPFTPVIVGTCVALETMMRAMPAPSK